MINYYLEQEQFQVSLKVKKIIKERLSKARKYQPFHLDCQHTNKKVCHCLIQPASKLSGYQQRQLWKQFDAPYNFYNAYKQQQLQQAQKTYNKTIEKIRHLDKAEIVAYVRNIKELKMASLANESYQNSHTHH